MRRHPPADYLPPFVEYGTGPFARTGVRTRLIGVPICPDLLDYEAIGAADNMRGRVVRGFFWLMRAWPT